MHRFLLATLISLVTPLASASSASEALRNALEPLVEAHDFSGIWGNVRFEDETLRMFDRFVAKKLPRR